jgi:hypothetical protein
MAASQAGGAALDGVVHHDRLDRVHPPPVGEGCPDLVLADPPGPNMPGRRSLKHSRK